MSENGNVKETALIPAENAENLPTTVEVGVFDADSLITVKQLPIIAEQLKSVKPFIENKVEAVLALGCNEDTVKAIKVLRAELNKIFKKFEERRKIVKQTVSKPYDDFNETYEDCVASLFKDTDTELKKRIDEVELNLKSQKAVEIENYFDEYLKSKNIDFVTFAMSNIDITLSASIKSLKEQVRAFIDRICDDLVLIDTQEHKEEILVEYKSTLNASAAIATVVTRHKAIDDEKAKAEQAEQLKQEQQATIEKVNAVAKAENAPLSAPKTAEADPIIIMKIGNTRIKAKKSDCVILKNLLSNGKYEILK